MQLTSVLHLTNALQKLVISFSHCLYIQNLKFLLSESHEKKKHVTFNSKIKRKKKEREKQPILGPVDLIFFLFRFVALFFYAMVFLSNCLIIFVQLHTFFCNTIIVYI